jgi:hypothetical protein
MTISSDRNASVRFSLLKGAAEAGTSTALPTRRLMLPMDLRTVSGASRAPDSEAESPAPPELAGERYLTARELGRLLGTSPRWVMDKHRAGRIPSFCLPGSNQVRFLASEVRKSLERKE